MSKSGHSTCPACGQRASGNFCQHCGAQLGKRFCNQCGKELTGGAKFCNQCGNQVGGGAAVRAPAPAGGGARRQAAGTTGDTSNLPWWIAGAAMFVLIVFVGTSMVRSEGPSVPPGATGGNPAAGPSEIDITQMSPIEAADRLYVRVMSAAENGDSAVALQFLPMALNAYEIAEPLNHDGRFHVSLMQRVGGMYEDALGTAQVILAENADHLLGLLAAAEAADALGQADEAARYYQRIVDVYDAQMAAPLREYIDHGNITEPLKAEAEAYLAGR